jgi:uncharacterized membrane protein YdjX (TVP38/TMEM64 family)
VDLKWDKIKGFLPLIVLFLGIGFLGTLIPQEKIRMAVENAGIYAPLIFILASLISYIIAPLSNMPVMAAGHYSFGSEKIIIYGFVAGILAAITNFWVARIWGVKLVKKLVGKKTLVQINELAEDYGLGTLLMVRLFAWGFNDVISYAAGFTNINFKPYFIITVIAMVPGTIIMLYATRYIENTTQFVLINLGLTTVFLLILPYTKNFAKRLTDFLERKLE